MRFFFFAVKKANRSYPNHSVGYKRHHSYSYKFVDNSHRKIGHCMDGRNFGLPIRDCSDIGQFL